MTHKDDTAALSQSLSAAQRLVRRRSAPLGALPLTILLTVSGGGGLMLASLWLTEPGTLPARTQAAFGACLVIAACWTVFAIHGLVHRRGVLLNQRVIASAMGLAFCLLFAVFGVSLALVHGEPAQSWGVGATGGTLVLIAAASLWSALRARRELIDLRGKFSGGLR